MNMMNAMNAHLNEDMIRYIVLTKEILDKKEKEDFIKYAKIKHINDINILCDELSLRYDNNIDRDADINVMTILIKDDLCNLFKDISNLQEGHTRKTLREGRNLKPSSYIFKRL